MNPANEKVDQARSNLERAVQAVKQAQYDIAEALDRDILGNQDWSPTYKDKLGDLEVELVEVRVTISRIMNRI